MMEKESVGREKKPTKKEEREARKRAERVWRTQGKGSIKRCYINVRTEGG